MTEENEVVDAESIVEAAGFEESVETKAIGFFAGINSGFVAGVAGGEQQTEMLIVFVLAALGIRAAPGRFENVKKAPEFALSGLAIGFLAGYLLKNPEVVTEALPA